MKQDTLAALIVCWFGKLPDYMPIWLRSCEANPEFTFLLLTDHQPAQPLPKNVRYLPFTREDFLQRAKTVVPAPSVNKPYRVCDFRPMFGKMFGPELADYGFWGYCDMDLVFGRLEDFVNGELLQRVDAVFNGGHFSLYRNCEKMNSLFMQGGAIFDYRRVGQKEAIYAFDETTGIQRIARKNGIRAQFGIPYVEADARFTQLRCRVSRENPPIQGYYWEDGRLYRVKAEEGQLFYQTVAYIHLQKRKIAILDPAAVRAQGFYITPAGFTPKYISGAPAVQVLEQSNPWPGQQIMDRELSAYKKQKLVALLKRGPYGIYVRLKQQKAGINAGDGTKEARPWEKY